MTKYYLRNLRNLRMGLGNAGILVLGDERREMCTKEFLWRNMSLLSD